MYSKKLRKLKMECVPESKIGIVVRIKEFCEREDLIDVLAEDVYKLYKEFCAENGYDIPRPQVMGMAIKKAYGLETKGIRCRGTIKRIYYENDKNKD